MNPVGERRQAVVLVSGGLDSATVLALAREQGFECFALSVDYGQRHAAELVAARLIASQLGAREHRTLRIESPDASISALTNPNIPIPRTGTSGIPVTYVPARNTILLAHALSWAEALGADDLFIGVNAVDYSGYPDCRPEFIEAFQRLAGLATRAGVEGSQPRIHAPLIAMSKAQIIREAVRLGVDLGATVSCYAATPEGRACGSCDACRLRSAGFRDAGVTDPTRYAQA